MDIDTSFYVSKSRGHHRNLHAYDLGASGTVLRDPTAADRVTCFRHIDGIGIELHILLASDVFNRGRLGA